MSAHYPDVPQTAGVPPVNRSAANPPHPPPVTRDQAFPSAVGYAIQDAWGIFAKDGSKALDPDSFSVIEFKRELRISDYPQEAGGFQSYNKVATPFDVRVTVTKGGSTTDRTAFLAAVAAMVNGLDLFVVSQPERTYTNVNFVMYDYRRSGSEGAGLLTVELMGEEVRITAKGAYSTTKSPSGANVQNGGPVRPQAPSKPQMPPRRPS